MDYLTQTYEERTQKSWTLQNMNFMSKTWIMPKCGNVKRCDSKVNCAKRRLVKHGALKTSIVEERNRITQIGKTGICKTWTM